MKTPMRISSIIVTALALLGVLALAARPAAAQANQTAKSLFDAVNNLRTGENLGAYQANEILMKVAQEHSRYQASLDTWTHIGPNGTTALQRATNAGYGTGKTVTCAESVIFGYQMSAGRAIEMWSAGQDKDVLISELYADTGVGAYIAENGNIFYTLMVCSAVSQASTATPTSAGEVVWGVSTTTPEADGAIYHIIQEGQALESIARAYGITLANLRALNDLQANQSIFPGDVLLIRPANTPTPTLEIPPSPTPITLDATATLRPTRTPSTPSPAVVQATLTPRPTTTPAPFEWVGSPQVGNGLLGMVVLSAAAGIILIAYGFTLRRK